MLGIQWQMEWPAKVIFPMSFIFLGIVAHLEATQTVATPEPQTPGPSQTPVPGPEFMPIVVRIEYSLRNPVDGMQFVLPTDTYPYVSVSNDRVHSIGILIYRSAFLMHTPSLPLSTLRDVGSLASITFGRGVLGNSNLLFRGIWKSPA